MDNKTSNQNAIRINHTRAQRAFNAAVEELKHAESFQAQLKMMENIKYYLAELEKATKAFQSATGWE